jgi:hypothetical protein
LERSGSKHQNPFLMQATSFKVISVVFFKSDLAEPAVVPPLLFLELTSGKHSHIFSFADSKLCWNVFWYEAYNSRSSAIRTNRGEVFEGLYNVS